MLIAQGGKIFFSENWHMHLLAMLSSEFSRVIQYNTIPCIEQTLQSLLILNWTCDMKIMLEMDARFSVDSFLFQNTEKA